MSRPRSTGPATDRLPRRHRRAATDEPREEDWVALKVYPGAHPGAMDFVVAAVLPQVLAQVELDRWFFTRSLDPLGPHVRLRLRAPAGKAAALGRASMLACHRALDGLSELIDDTYRPLVPLAAEVDGGLADEPPVAVQPAEYEPELEKYGGEPGVGLAEQLFEASSTIASSVVRADLAGTYSRKTMAPSLMASVAEVFWPRPPAATWRSYADFWLGGETVLAREWRERFLAQANWLHERGTPVVVSPAELPEEACQALERWTAVLHSTHAGYRRIDTLRELAPQQLGFHFIHMMNNRLGLHPLEEAYLATLLEQRTAPASAADGV